MTFTVTKSSISKTHMFVLYKILTFSNFKDWIKTLNKKNFLLLKTVEQFHITKDHITHWMRLKPYLTKISKKKIPKVKIALSLFIQVCSHEVQDQQISFKWSSSSLTDWSWYKIKISYQFEKL